MAETKLFIDGNAAQGGTPLSATTLAALVNLFIGSGYIANYSGATTLQVVQTSPLGLTVGVNDGAAVGRGQGYILAGGGVLTTLSVTANGSAGTRPDFVVLRFALSASGQSISLYVKPGTSGSPGIDPTLQRDAVAYELALARVRVANGITQITTAMIDDLRNDPTYCGIAQMRGAPTVYDTAAGPSGQGASASTPIYLRTTTNPQTYTVPAGFDWHISNINLPPSGYFSINGTQIVTATGSYNNDIQFSAPLILTAGTTITFAGVISCSIVGVQVLASGRTTVIAPIAGSGTYTVLSASGSRLRIQGLTNTNTTVVLTLADSGDSARVWHRAKASAGNMGSVASGVINSAYDWGFPTSLVVVPAGIVLQNTSATPTGVLIGLYES